MELLKLRNYIPIGAPARREPADGSETDMRVSLGFEPAWFSKRCGVDFSETWHLDPYYRCNSLEKMKQELLRAFPTVPNWDLANHDDLATISGCYGAYVIPRVFGIPLRYARERWPELDRPEPFTVEEIERMDADKLLSGAFVDELFRQMDLLEKGFGKIHGYLNWQGVLNNAFHLRKQEVFIDLVERPKFAHQMFSLITDVMIRFAKMVQERQRKSGFYTNHLVAGNCTVSMISPGAYREFIFPCDKRIAESFERFGVHTCNWDVTPYIEVLKPLPKLGYLDMGIMTDMARVKNSFPDARRAVIYHPNTLQTADLETIAADMKKIKRDLAPCDVVMADISESTSDERVNAFLTICRDLSSKGD